ncbi:unnamed protein product [Lactuca saligna]|uniref:Uncharacterized protein n=1 Tax=Lactuca saligna TaxID=75948 RepID=A0AA36EB64_LACSI|nr:unnamed protein product [Lactuca saligna]
MLILMNQRAISSCIPFVYQSNEGIHQELQPSIAAVKAMQSSEVHVPVDNMNDPLQDNVVAIRDDHEPTNMSCDPPSNIVSVVDIPSPDVDDEALEEIMFEDDNTTVGVLPIRTSLNIFQNPSSSKAYFHFELFSYLKASYENVEPEKNDFDHPPPENTSKGHQDSPPQEVTHDDDKSKEDVDHVSESSTSNTGSFDENIMDMLCLMELKDNVPTANSKVDKVIQQVVGLESKHYLVVKSLSERKDVTPS